MQMKDSSKNDRLGSTNQFDLLPVPSIGGHVRESQSAAPRGWSLRGLSLLMARGRHLFATQMCLVGAWISKARSTVGWQVFSVGLLIGLLSFSAVIPWLMAWGAQTEFKWAAMLMFATGILVASRRGDVFERIGGDFSVLSSLLVVCSPLIQFFVSKTLSLLPLDVVVIKEAQFAMAILAAFPSWFGLGFCFSRLLKQKMNVSVRRNRTHLEVLSMMACGLITGMVLNSILLAWSFDIQVISISCLLMTGIAYLFRASKGSSRASAVDFPESAQKSESQMFDRGTLRIMTSFARGFPFCVLGALFVIGCWLLNQLFPESLHHSNAQWMALVFGCVVGLFMMRSRFGYGVNRAWVMPFALVWGVSLFVFFSNWVFLSLWMNSTLTSASLLLMARNLIWVVGIAPLGIAYALILNQSRSEVEDNAAQRLCHSDASDVLMNMLRSLLPFVIGICICESLCHQSGIEASLTLVSVLVLMSTLAVQVRSLFQVAEQTVLHRIGLMSPVAMMVVAVGGLSLTTGHVDLVQSTKLLFSTSAFIAYRSGWEAPALTQLDDVRLVKQINGENGPLTLWRSRGYELQLREGGIPRSVISSDVRVHPQFAPEVLLSSLPMVIADRPSRVMVVGISGGVPLSTCLQFPVQNVVCVEGDRCLLSMLNGPVASETGFNPLHDERVQLIPVSPVLALTSNSFEPFDVILSSPAPASTARGAALYTAEFYRRVSSRLSERGLFCQRFESLDFGPEPIRVVIRSLRASFRQVVAIETGAGEFLFIASNFDGDLLPADLPARLESPHVRRLLARSGLDWSAPLNFPAYDHAALGEMCAGTFVSKNENANGILAIRAPMDVIRWGPKLQEVQQMLTARRSTAAQFSVRSIHQNDVVPRHLPSELKLSRRSRFLDWLGDSLVSAELLRRLAEVTTQQKLVRENPDAHWWEYRKALREQLQDHPRSSIQQVSHVRGEKVIHAEDLQRKAYFEALGAAVSEASPNAEKIAAIEACLEPFDPLLSYFAQQEIADLQARTGLDPASELAHRLHVIYFTPAADASVRNVVGAIELLSKHPEAIPEDGRRFDVMNSLVQTLRVRWEQRQNLPIKSARRQMNDVDRSVIAVEHAVLAMEKWSPLAGVSHEDWASRRRVIDRMLLNPLRGYHSQLFKEVGKRDSEARAAIDEAQNGAN